MKKFILSVGLFLLVSAAFHLNAQSIDNKNWKAFLGQPFNDSLTFHIKADSSYVTTSTGEVLVQTSVKITGDVLTLADYSTTEYSCPDATGKYKVELSKDGNSFTLTLVEDACEGRAQALNGLKWVKVPK